MLPLSDAPNSSKTPFVTYALIALNVLVIYLLFTLPMSGQAPSPGDPRVAAYVEALRESLPAACLDARGRRLASACTTCSCSSTGSSPVPPS